MKIAIITGASSGLGSEFVKQISKQEKLDEITDKDGIGRIDKGQYYLGFQKKGNYITGYWYEQKMGEELESSKYLARFL